MIRRGVAAGRDTSVGSQVMLVNRNREIGKKNVHHNSPYSLARLTQTCLLNYKADGTPFWNQFFVAPLRDADGTIVNFVGVQCEVRRWF